MTELNLWPEPSLTAIEETARRILCEVGVDVQSSTARELFLSAGCELLPSGRVAVPWDVVERSAAVAPRRFTLAARDDARSLAVSSDGSATWAHPLGGAHSVVDAVTGELRRAQSTDAAAAARVQHHLRRPDMVTPLFMPGDLPGDLEPLVSYLICLQETDKCVSGPPLWSAEQVRGVCKLADLVLGADPGSGRYSVNLSFSPLSPLTLGANVADALVEAARLGASCVILPCPIAGTTAPAPIAATVAQQTAEALAGVVLAEAAFPGTPVTCASRLMPCDPHTGAAVMGGPELALAAQAATSIMRKLGLPSDVYGLSTDSKVIDAQFGFERAIGALVAATTRPAFLSGMGFMQSGIGGSLEALVIDDEILRYVAWLLEERPADEAAMNVDAVKQAVSTSAGFLGLRQTRAYLRTESVQRQLAHSGALSLDEWLVGGHDLLARASDVVAEALARPPVGLGQDVVDAATDILGETAERMGLEAPDLPGILESCRGQSLPAAARRP
jgi:trimethylamine--corrinoid protein Co-methyltransferase